MNVNLWSSETRGNLGEASKRKGKKLSRSHEATANSLSQRGRKPINGDGERRSGSRTSMASEPLLPAKAVVSALGSGLHRFMRN
jgi:hypothetical protein